MTPDSSLFLAVAQIAGIFVGFGGIIGTLGDFHARTEAAKLLQSVVSMSLSAMTAALIPATLIQFQLDPQILWQLSAGIYILLIWLGGSLVVLFNPDYRAWFRAHVKRAPFFAALFWIGLEVPIQVSLFLALFNVVPLWSQGFYVTALMFNLFQAATLLTRFLFEKPKE
ncbi:MAG: hypothetical protein ABL973_17755 [Micropepsaceae bacterium]